MCVDITGIVVAVGDGAGLALTAEAKRLELGGSVAVARMQMPHNL